VLHAQATAGHTLQGMAPIHEAYFRLIGQGSAEWRSRAQCFGVASKAMWSILVDYARARLAAKRGVMTVGAADSGAGEGRCRRGGAR
jgi:ECF sigma factor